MPILSPCPLCTPVALVKHMWAPHWRVCWEAFSGLLTHSPCLTFLCSDIHLTTASRSFITLPLSFSFILCCCFVRFLSGISYSAIKMTFLAELTDLFNNIFFYRSVAQLQSRKRLLRFCWHLADVICQRMRDCDAISYNDRWRPDRGN